MFADPQFWVAVSFFLFIAVIFNPVRKILTTNLDSQIHEIKNKIEEAENLKNEAQKTLSELKIRESEVEKEINELKLNSQKKISQLKEISSKKLSEQIDRRKLLAENKIEQLTRDANVEIQHHISKTAISAAINLLEKKLDEKEKQNLINTSIKEIDSVLKN